MSVMSKANGANTMRRAEAKKTPTRNRSVQLLRFVPLLGLMALLLIWQLLSMRYPPFILPAPLAVAQRFIEKLVVEFDFVADAL